MKTTLEEISPVKKRLIIEIEPQEVEKRLRKAYGDLSKKAKIRGFRPGKIPRKVLENYFGPHVQEEVGNELMNESFPKAVQEANLYPLGEPVIEKGRFLEDQTYSYSAILDVAPQVSVENYLGVEVLKGKPSVSDEDVEARLNQIRQKNGKWVSIEPGRPIQEKDLVMIDYRAMENGIPIEGVQSPDLQIMIGRADLHPHLDTALLGLSKGDSTATELDFPVDYYHQKLAGKRVTFEVTIGDIKELRVPPLDDAFAQALDPDFKDLGILRAQIRKTLLNEERLHIEEQLHQAIVEKIAANVHVELPEIMVAGETEQAFQGIKANLEAGGGSLEQAGLSEEKLRNELRPTSEWKVKRSLILSEIATREGIRVSKEEMDEAYDDIALRMGQDRDTVIKYHELKGYTSYIEQQIIEQKTLKHLVAHATITEVEKSALEPGVSGQEVQ